MKKSPVIAIHGGAGTLSAASKEQARPYHDALHQIVTAGQRALLKGSTAVDAVCLAVSMLEDSPLFNAGHGAVFTHDAAHELDAAVMNGATLNAGAIAGVQHIKNPIYGARAVMDDGRHVMFIGDGAEKFLKGNEKIEFVDASYFSTPMRREQLNEAIKQGAVALDHNVKIGRTPIDEGTKMGTVGAVALDQYGNLAAATSTGGMTNKLAGRVGDTPIIGAGTYADNRTAAISCTGHGEMFIRVVAAYDVCARMLYGKQTLQQACDEVVMKTLKSIGGEGGLIAIDAQGNVYLPFNSEGMYRGYAKGEGAPITSIYHD